MKLIDNVTSLFGDDLKANLTRTTKLKIMASYFSIYAYSALKAELEKIEELQFIFTSPTFVPEKVTDRLKKEKREFIIPKSDRENSLYGTEYEIHLRNRLTQKAIARECAEWIKRKVTFKSNISNGVMQEFITLNEVDNNVTYMPIQGFTTTGLGYEKGKAVSNMVNAFSEPHSLSYLQLFDQIWNDLEKVEDITSEIIQHIESVYQENSPEHIYFLMLYNIFKDFLTDIDEDVMPNEKTGYQETVIWNKLFNFQKDAVKGLINKLEKYNGCVLADSVGLGKTFTALAVIKYYELRNKSVLVLCPKKLNDNWTTYNTNVVTNILAKDRFNYDVLFHTDLSREAGTSNGIDLGKVNWGNYDLVVIDESHNFRNRDTFKDRETRYQKLMDKVIRQGVKTKVLMLSATPVNNRFNDLKNQLALAYEGNSSLLNEKLDTERDIDTIFARAQASFNRWAKLPAEQRTTQEILNLLDFDFFKLLDSVTIARSRKHIQTFYDTKDIGQFPTRRMPISHRRPISKATQISLEDIFKQLTSLNMAVYAPMSYIFPSAMEKYEDLFDTVVNNNSRFKQVDREKSLQSLMTVNLLKRLESSVHSFRLTLNVLKDKIENALKQIASFEQKQLNDDFILDDYSENEFDDDEYIGKTLKINLKDMDVISWRTSLVLDLDIVNELLSVVNPITPEYDDKLQHLKEQIIQKIHQPINKDNKKIIIFTAFADTADYLYQQLSGDLLTRFGIHSAKITGSNNLSTIKTQPNSKHSYDMQGLLTLFSPISKQKADIFPNESREIDILIATDCISEGQNLQDCDYLINFDIHWNPVRIIQRFGRIDRIGSPNSEIQLVNYWPDISLDEYINLRERVENRMIIVDMTSTGDDNVLTAKSNDIAYRKEQLQRLQTEVLDLEETNAGVSITDLGLNDFRMDLLNYMEHNPDLARLPNGLHTVVPAMPQLGLHAGVIFTLKSRAFSAEQMNQNRLYPYYLVYIQQDGTIVYDYTKAKHLLDLARLACRDKSIPIPAAYEPFNRKTKDGREMKYYSELLDTVIENIRNVKAEKDIDSLFNGLNTTALIDDIQSLSDFELISFIVIEDAV